MIDPGWSVGNGLRRMVEWWVSPKGQSATMLIVGLLGCVCALVAFWHAPGWARCAAGALFFTKWADNISERLK